MKTRRNIISGRRGILPRLMWADCDPDDKRTPLVVYQTKADQRGNRPDLEPRRVVVIALDPTTTETAQTDLLNALLHYRKIARKRR